MNEYQMPNSPGGWGQNSPFPPQVPYWETPEWKCKKQIRHVSNVMGWSCFAVQVLMLALSFLSTQILLMIGYPFNRNLLNSGGMSSEMYYLLVSVVYIISVAGPFLLCVAFMKLPVAETFPFEKVGFSTSVLFVLFGVGVCMLSNIPGNIVAIILEEMGFNATLPESVPTDSVFSTILCIIEIAVIPPLVEELAFRGVILSQLRKYGKGFAVFGSALLFAFYHGNFIQFTFTFIVGLLLGFIMVQTNNLWITIVIHALNNGLSLFFDMISDVVSSEVYDMLNNFLFFGLILLGIVSLVVLMLRKREYFQRRYEPMLLSASARVSAFVLNPGFIAFLVVFLGSSLESLLG